MTKDKTYRRTDDERPGRGRRLTVDGQPVTDEEAHGMAQASVAILILRGYLDNPDEAPEEVKAEAREAAIRWLRAYRESKKFFDR